ncbi:hypothetical protein J6590_043822 [Homalodisca vitripennis]|nr:hypothetical protein J6590_043822 [Homalodisca vitripennis]
MSGGVAARGGCAERHELDNVPTSRQCTRCRPADQSHPSSHRYYRNLYPFWSDMVLRIRKVGCRGCLLSRTHEEVSVQPPQSTRVGDITLSC